MISALLLAALCSEEGGKEGARRRREGEGCFVMWKRVSRSEEDTLLDEVLAPLLAVLCVEMMEWMGKGEGGGRGERGREEGEGGGGKRGRGRASSALVTVWERGDESSSSEQGTQRMKHVWVFMGGGQGR